ncbi:MAG: valine--tRNA ligase [Candidatus Bathyarchaeia archaeon]
MSLAGMLPTNFKPKIAEKRWKPERERFLVEEWSREGIYKFDRTSGKPIFSIDTPPPYASGRWHVGGATHYAQIDMVARYYRMKGYEVLFSFGIDRNGLPVEVEVEKRHNLNAHEIPREKFIALCKEFLDSVEKEIISTARRLGMSCNFEGLYRTDSAEYRKITQSTFIELWNRGLIYEDNRPTNWCPACQTTLADAEVEYADLETSLCYIRFRVKEGGEIVVATTRPELICSCAAVIYHPEDERYRHLEGRHAITPIYNAEVPLIPSHYAKPEFGTGIAMICSFGDYTDVKLFRELDLKPKIAITKTGRMNSQAGILEGLKVEEARSKMIDLLEEAELLSHRERIIHKTPICWRSKNPIEFIEMPEYYLKQLPFLGELAADADKMKFHPPEAKQLLLNWINSVSTDWPITRRRYYGTEVPLWYCRECGKPYLPPPGAYYQPWRERPPNGRCSCGSIQFVGETRTFDTWMDSSISQLYILGYGWDNDLLTQSFPCTLRPQGTDIVRTWLYYSMLRTRQLLSALPFKHVRISGMGLDENGEAMHKSKGNIIWPEPIIEELGADAFRLWGASEARLGSDYRFSRERLEGAARFITKLWNVSRFVSSFPQPSAGEAALMATDQMILADLNNLIQECEKGYEEMDFFIPAQSIRGFLWGIFADHYVEAVKTRAYNLEGKFTRQEQEGAWMTLHTVIKTALKLLAPICPFVTDAIWRAVYAGTSIHKEDFPRPRPEWKSELGMVTQSFMEFNSTVWKFKRLKGIALNDEIKAAYATEDLQPLEKDLAAMHRIRFLSFSTPPKRSDSPVEKVGSVYLVA